MTLKNVGDKQYVVSTNSKYVYLLERMIKDDSKFVCEAASEESAKMIADMLNEAEGF